MCIFRVLFCFSFLFFLFVFVLAVFKDHVVWLRNYDNDDGEMVVQNMHPNQLNVV